MDPVIIDTLLTSFRQVPPGAIPAMLDCILTSTGSSPSLLFSSLLNQFPNLSKEFEQGNGKLVVKQRESMVSYLSALCHLLNKKSATGDNVSAMHLFTWKIWIPLLRLVHSYDYELFNESTSLFCDVVIKGDKWEVVEATVVPFLLRLIGLSLDKWSCTDSENHFLDESDNNSIFPLSVSCNILAILLDSALQVNAQKFVGNLVWDLSEITFQMLLESLEHRASAIRFFLPSIFKVVDSTYSFEAGQKCVLSRRHLSGKVWEYCKLLFSVGPLESRDAYTILSLYSSFSTSWDDITSDERFWDEMKKGLVNKESFVRKQSLHILKAAVKFNKKDEKIVSVTEAVPHSNGMTKKGMWAEKEAKSLGVGKICNFSEQKWEAFFLLYEMLEEYGTHLVEAAWNNQIGLLLHSCLNFKDIQMENSMQIFGWLAVLWERGFSHDNPQVRCLVMQSFLSIEWEKYGDCAKLVKESFIHDPLIQGLNDPVHHKDFGVNGVYSSWTIEAASKFIYQYAFSMEKRKQCSFMIGLASVAKKQSFGRAGLMCFVECIASAAHGFDLIQVKDAQVELLEILKYIIETSKQHFNSNYRQQVCKKILSAAASVTSALNVPLEILVYFISSLPREYTDHGGLLRLQLEEWLIASNENLELLKLLNEVPFSFVRLEKPTTSISISFDDEDLDAWECEAKRWARMFFLVIKNEQDLEPILKFIEEYGIHICKQNRNSVMPVKYLILVSSLVDELEIIQTRMKGTSYLMIYDKFAKSFSYILEEIVSFAKVSCSIFWSKTEKGNGGPLCGSIKGRLGGPSQRRLSSLTTTLILQAITSVKIVASISSWCKQLKADVTFDSAFTFLWELCGKIITSHTCQSESEAEICLAAYESLAYLLKSLVPNFSPLSLKLLMRNNTCIDKFLTTFLHNMNSLISVGYFARSRRAVLMNWKWICLESLLAIPNKVDNLCFSDVTLRLIFDDLIGSLENAGEISVLPMLRSVRLILDLFASAQTGVTLQMIWNLVNSSWILHISCNKRRVAPIAALLSSVLHNSVFSNENMHQFNGAPGPMKWFVEKILEEGTRSPRTIRLAALHLAGLWLTNPNTIKFYIKDLKLLTLYGSVAFDEDFESELAENQEAKIEVSVLAKSPDSELTKEFLNTELYARVSIAVLFYKLESTNESGKIFLLDLLNSAINDKDLSKELYKKHSSIHRRKVRVWQMICVLSRFIDEDILEKVTTNLHISIQMNNLPSVRQYLETFAIQIYLRFPSLVSQELVSMLQIYDLRPQALSSYVFIAANVILHSTKELQTMHLEELLPPIVPLLTSHHHTLRGFTQLLVYLVLQKLLPVNNSPTASIEKKCFEDLKHYLSNNPDCARLRASMEGYLEAFDPKVSISPSGIFSNRVELKELEFECVSTSLMDRVINFLNVTREDLRCSMVKDATAIKNESLHTNGDLITPKTESQDFQKKIIISRHDMDNGESFKSLTDMESEDEVLYEVLHSRCEAVEKLKGSRQDIIIVASLIDRIPNLAGLARTCEVFKASALAVSDKSVVNDKQFQLISVTAEKWVPIIEVPIGNVMNFLEKKKQQGYAILGLEQTANSVSLDQFHFPKKTVLVLGREKEGIPVELIQEMDGCIEIPQLGVVRSLNVHVSGAIALWEYTRQHR